MARSQDRKTSRQVSMFFTDWMPINLANRTECKACKLSQSQLEHIASMMIHGSRGSALAWNDRLGRHLKTCLKGRSQAVKTGGFDGWSASDVAPPVTANRQLLPFHWPDDQLTRILAGGRKSPARHALPTKSLKVAQRTADWAVKNRHGKSRKPGTPMELERARRSQGRSRFAYGRPVALGCPIFSRSRRRNTRTQNMKSPARPSKRAQIAHQAAAVFACPPYNERAALLASSTSVSLQKSGAAAMQPDGFSSEKSYMRKAPLPSGNRSLKICRTLIPSDGPRSRAVPGK
ncbi:hypothetical protein AMK01_PD00639 (plasmid) [Rhizobium sp. N6212]|nr:hypothetical protein AMK01_PD00639 [Rhizobium sp. N6212]ANL01570.1 hypothetical protein AMK00_PD00637 [Rhizobium sp. N621]ANL07698.1 hypothetical protein AMJ99_PD00644 [Rhizobium esperanzae]ANL13869.1 hypothetical protein AMJ98_PE00645 [Rhizobium sp. N1341]ANM38539.1 hypothetical protein AMK04_PD00645 [Rhizobium sp. N871]ANM44694.1 hypothetical protein AMK03_PE00646 [Rhizobium sp. N741]